MKFGTEILNGKLCGEFNFGLYRSNITTTLFEVEILSTFQKYLKKYT